jgi:hypothetical protein
MTEDQLIAWRQRQEGKAAAQRRFAKLEVEAAVSQVEARRRKPQPAPKRPVALAEPRRSTTTYVRVARPCEGTCGRMVRPPKSRLADFPGTAKGARVGLCETCHGNGPKRRKTPSTCVRCEGPLYRRRDEPRDGARRHAGRGLCTRCYSEEARA